MINWTYFGTHLICRVTQQFVAMCGPEPCGMKFCGSVSVGNYNFAQGRYLECWRTDGNWFKICIFCNCGWRRI